MTPFCIRSESILSKKWPGCLAAKRISPSSLCPPLHWKFHFVSVRFAFEKEAPLKIRASLSTNELYPGSFVDLTLRLQNESTKKITRAEVFLTGFLCTTVEDTGTIMGRLETLNLCFFFF